MLLTANDQYSAKKKWYREVNHSTGGRKKNGYEWQEAGKNGYGRE